MQAPTLDNELDLILTRDMPLPPDKLYQGWTDPELLRQWFVPRPWTIAEARVDVRPGGGSHIVMRSPEGQDIPMHGCYLEVVENRRIVFTDALTEGYRPAADGFFTGIITFDPIPQGTRYTARALHKSAEDRAKHEAMGFHEGWGKCLDQLVELMSR